MSQSTSLHSKYASILLTQLHQLTKETHIPVDITEITHLKITQYSAILSHHVTKLVLMWINLEDIAECTHLMEEFMNDVNGLLVYVRSLLNGANKTMKKQIINAQADILNSLQTLFISFRDASIKELQNQNKIAQKTGILWDNCELLNSIPINNSEAVSKVLMSNLKLVKDASLELKDMIKDAKEDLLLEGEHDEKNDNDLDDLDDLDDDISKFDDLQDYFDNQKFTSLEIERLDSCYILYTFLFLLVKTSYSYVLKSGEHDANNENFEIINDYTCSLINLIDELGGLLYTPQDSDLINSKVIELCKLSSNVMKLLPADNLDALNVSFEKVKVEFKNLNLE